MDVNTHRRKNIFGLWEIAMRAVVVHLGYEEFGGAEFFSIRVIEILQCRFDNVLVLHAGDLPKFEAIMARTGISLNPQRVRFQTISKGRRSRFLNRFVPSMTLFRLGEIRRLAERVVRDGDVVVSTFAEFPFKRAQLVQALHIPIFVSDRESLLYCGVEACELRRLFRKIHVWLARKYMGLSSVSLADGPVVVNSHWTAEQFRRHYPLADIRVLHHGVSVDLHEGSPGWVPFHEREDSFVIIGRLVKAKRVETAIDIIERVRGLGHEVRLKIIGDGTGDYAAEIFKLAESKPWIDMYPNLSRKELETLVVGQKWGLHCYQFEHYGLAPGELQALGCITFVHDSGGQVEIIDHPAQRYSDVVDAVKKISLVLSSYQLQVSLIANAKASIAHHRGEHFVQKFGSIIEDVAFPQT